MREHTDQTTHPRKARRQFIESKRQTLKESTIRCYQKVTEDFVEYLESNGIEATEDIDGYTIEQWKLKRKDQDNVAPITIRNNSRHIRVFIKWLEASELVSDGLTDKIQIPTVSDEQARSDKKITADQITSILGYLDKYEYATRIHAVTQLLWHTGCRISTAVSLDLQDFHPGQEIIQIRNRRDTGTPLKNGLKSERNVTINEQTVNVLNDYINARRDDVVDENNREPLFTTPHGRMERQRAYKDFIGVSRPCVYSRDCPHGRTVDSCDPAQRKKEAYNCPSSESLHPIRRGAITYHLKNGWDIQEVSERCDVSRDVLEKHYDARTHEEKRKKRAKKVDKL